MYKVMRHNIHSKSPDATAVQIASFQQRYVAVQVVDFLNLKERNQSIYYRLRT